MNFDPFYTVSYGNCFNVVPPVNMTTESRANVTLWRTSNQSVNKTCVIISTYDAENQQQYIKKKLCALLQFHASKNWLVGCFGFKGPLRQYFSLYRVVSQREGERGEKG